MSAHAVARRRLVESHTGLADRLARRFARRGVEVDDLRQVACLALVKSARAFDPRQGAYSPYAAATIRGDLKKYFRDHAWTVRPPRRIQELQARIRAVDPHRRYGARRLAADLGEDAADVTEALAARGCFQPDSLDRRVRPDDEGAMAAVDLMPVEDEGFEHVEDRLTLRSLCGDLDDEDRELIRLRFVDDLTQQQIADRLGVSQMQISRRLRRVIGDLRRRADAG